MELQHVAPASLDQALGRLRLLPEAAIHRMAESLQSKGQMAPLVAAKRPAGLMLIDGFVRTLAALRLGLDQVIVEVVEVSDAQMKAQVYLRNRDRGLQLVEECRLVHELERTDGLSQVDIGDTLERHKSWVCRRLALYRGLSPHLRDDGALTALGSGSIRRLALLPHRNQEQLVTILRRERFSPQQSATYLDLWRKATTDEARQYLLTHPREAVRLASQKAKKTPAADPRLGEAGQYVVNALLAMEQVSLLLSVKVRLGLAFVWPG